MHPTPPQELPGTPVISHGEAAVVTVPVRMCRFAARNRHATIPLTVPLALLAAGKIAHAEHAGFELAVVGVAATVTVFVLAPHKWDRGGEVTYARYSVAGLSLWLILAAYLGVNPPLEILAGLGCAVWGGLFWWHKRPRGKRARRAHQRTVARWNRFWQSHAPAWGATGSGVIDQKEHGALESLLIQLWGGRQHLGTIKNIIPLLESALGGYVHHGMTRLEVNKANPSQVWVHLKRDDPLRGVIEWDESKVPGDITKPAPLGVRETGVWLTAVLRRGWFINGKTRRGKSNELSVIFAAITASLNARLWLIDMKGGRSMRPWLPAVDWPATTIEEARLVEGCAAAELEARGAYAYSGEEQLTPTAEVPTLFIAIDETYKVTSETRGDTRCAADLATIASQGSGLEIYPVVATQYGSLADSVRTEVTRGNLDGRMCFQVDSPSHGAFALGDDVHGKADPTTLREQGQFYVRLNAETSPEQIRGPHLPHELAREIAARNAKRTDLHGRNLLLYCGNMPCDLMPGMTWQQVYDSRWSRLPEVFRGDAPQAAGLSPAAAQPPTNKITNRVLVDDVVAAQIREINDEVDEMPDVSEADLARAAAQRAARGDGPVDLAGDSDHRRRRFAILLEGAGPEGITAKQLVQGSGFSREWVRRLLNALVEGNAAAKIGDGYRPLADVWEALEIWRENNERLAADAKRMTGIQPQ